MARTPISIRPATSQDLPSILRIQELNLLAKLIKNLDVKALNERGFLPYRVSEQKLFQTSQDPRGVVRVAVRAEQVVGYALAYDAELLNEEGLRTLDLAQIRSHCRAYAKLKNPRILYVEQVAIDFEWSEHADGKLLAHLCRKGPSRKGRKEGVPRQRDRALQEYGAIAAHLLYAPVKTAYSAGGPPALHDERLFKLYNKNQARVIGSQCFDPGLEELGRDFRRLGIKLENPPQWNVQARVLPTNGY